MTLFYDYFDCEEEPEGAPGRYYVNAYQKDEDGTLRRDTLFDELPQEEAENMVSLLNSAASLIGTAARIAKAARKENA